MSQPRTFRIKSPPVQGNDVQSWEKELKQLFAGIGVDAPLVSNGVYGDMDRSYTKSFAYAVGFDAVDVLDGGISPTDRTRLRHWRENQTPDEKRRMAERRDWRRRLRERYDKLRDDDQGHISLFLQKTLQDSWGYHPGVHDGIDLISLPDVPIFAPVDCKVIDVRSGGWWGLGAPADQALKAKGDGIVQVEILKTVGPFKKGYHIGFGHAEKAFVKVGQTLRAGQKVAHTGLANAWHIHLVYNNGTVGLRGIGNIDPRAIVEYAKQHG